MTQISLGGQILTFRTVQSCCSWFKYWKKKNNVEPLVIINGNKSGWNKGDKGKNWNILQ
jgi:hypothetical protein